MTLATGNRGFTLLELLIVLAILVLLAGAWPLAAPRLFPSQQLRNEAQKLVASIRNARMQARMTGVPQALNFNDSSDNYEVAAERHALARGIVARLRTEGIRQASRSMVFFPDGSTSGGAVDLLLANRSVRVEVGETTGRVAVSE